MHIFTPSLFFKYSFILSTINYPSAVFSGKLKEHVFTTKMWQNSLIEINDKVKGQTL